ncbi:MAG TPA: helix-hairpin-helix domain-containing protein, partial [Polyangia bacterium]|nr:helix-hairpin-helix domain-containing protein [Polyangia bacterium]
GKLLDHTLVNLVQGESAMTRAKQTLRELCVKYKPSAIAVGNGTHGRETEVFAREVLAAEGLREVPCVAVSEAGASIYSASEVAREEFPDLDLTVRGAISIARRLQDPLAELVKLDPKSIGVGQYQHDVSPTGLKKSLDGVVDSCVNQVGVDVNTASVHLLAHVSGIGPGLARAIVDHRAKEGLYASRAALLDVPRFSKKTFEQAAGFLRVPSAANPLDNTGVHPERYDALERLAGRLGVGTSALVGAGAKLVKQAKELETELGAFTFEDVIRELEKPGRDPRDAFVPFSFRADVHEMKDLQPGMMCPGIVTNVTNFGAFVDIGVHQDGLVHISHLADRFVKDPRDVVNAGDRVTVRVLEVKLDKKQIALTMKAERTERQAPSPPRGPSTPRERGPAAPPPRPSTPFNNPFAAALASKLPRR